MTSSPATRTSPPEVASEFVEAIKQSLRKELAFKIERSGEKRSELEVVSMTPDENFDGTVKIGVQLSPNTKFSKIRPKSVSEAFPGREFLGLSLNVVDSLKQTFLNFSQSVGKVLGPMAIIAVGAEVTRSNFDGLHQFADLIGRLKVIAIYPAYKNYF